MVAPPAATVGGKRWAVESEQPTSEMAFNASWAFILEAIGERTTRLLIRFRVGRAPSLPLTLFCRLLLEPERFVMERAMLRGIKWRAEATSR